MKNILIAVPTNKYIEPETMKSIYDLEVPDGYKTHFQFFYGYSRSQVKNLIAEWGKNYDITIFIKRDSILPKGYIRSVLKTDCDVIVNNKLSLFSIKKDILHSLKYPHFNNLETEKMEIEDFVMRVYQNNKQVAYLN